jgi:hypothetical protein
MLHRLRRFIPSARKPSFALVLAVAAAACFFWPRSYYGSRDSLFLQLTDTRSLWVATVRGGVEFRVSSHGPSDSGAPPLSVNTFMQYETTPSLWGEFYRDSSSWTVISNGGARQDWTAAIAAFLCDHRVNAALFLLTTVPMGWLRHWGRASRRARAGLCPTCAYDLRGSADHCPECGSLAMRGATLNA